jgi:hypothetical protein
MHSQVQEAQDATARLLLLLPPHPLASGGTLASALLAAV